MQSSLGQSLVSYFYVVTFEMAVISLVIYCLIFLQFLHHCSATMANKSPIDDIPIIASSDPRYDDLKRNNYNLRFMADVGLIAYPKQSKDVVSILRYAMKNILRPTVTSGGHCYEDFWSNNTN